MGLVDPGGGTVVSEFIFPVIALLRLPYLSTKIVSVRVLFNPSDVGRNAIAVGAICTVNEELIPRLVRKGFGR
jgi:hypothetical protein